MKKMKPFINKKYLLIIALVICAIVTYLTTRNPNSEEQLLLKGSTENIHKTGKQKKTLTIGISEPPLQSKLYLEDGKIANLSKQLIYEPLLYINKDLTIDYMLADSIKFSIDGLTAKIKLDENAFFSDHSKVTATDIKQSYLELNKNNYCTPTIVGVEEYYLGNKSDIEGIKIIDDSTLEITFKQVSITNLFDLSIPIFKTTENTYALGSGEYELSNFRYNDEIILKRNTKRKTSNYEYENIIIKKISSLQIEEEIKNYNLDVFEVSLNRDNKDIKKAGYHNVYEVNDAYTLNYFKFNLNDKVAKDINIRKAMTYGINKKDLEIGFEWNEKINESYLSSINEDANTNEYDLDKAKKFAKESTVTYLCLNDVASVLRYDEIKKAMNKIGISVEKTMNSNASIQYMSTHNEHPVLFLEEELLKSSLKEDYKKFLKNSYQNDVKDALQSLDEYIADSYMIIPISTRTYGLAISSDANQKQLLKLLMNS